MTDAWLHAAPLWAAAVVWLVPTGLPIASAIGLRGCAVWAAAPALAVATLSVAAVVAEAASVRWSPVVALGAVVLATLLALAVNGLVGRRPAPERRTVRACAAGGVLAAALLGGIALVLALRTPAALSQSFDAVFHYTALAAIRDSGAASSLTLGALGVPGAPPRFYPAAWHDVTALVLATVGGAVPAGANAVAGVVAVVVWPLACVFLARQVFGPRPGTLAVTGLYSVGFTAFPWGLLKWGVLWPNLLGMSLVPVALGLVLAVTGRAVDDAVGRPRALVLLPVTLVGMALAHPNTVVCLVVLASVLVLVSTAQRAREHGAHGRVVRAGWTVAAAVVVPVLLLTGLRATPLGREVAAVWWAPTTTTTGAVGEVLLHATHGRPAEWLLAAVVLVGVARSLRDPALRWLTAAHAVSAALFVMAASVQSPWTMVLTGFWYSDSWRIAAMLPITGVPLAVLGTVVIAERLRERIDLRVAVPVGATTLLIALVLAGATKGMHLGRTALVVHSSFAPEDAPATNLVSPEEAEFFARIRHRIEPDAVVANNPWDGSALLWPLQGRRVLFGQLDGRKQTAEQDYLAQNLVFAASDPRACQIAAKLGVRYLLVGEVHFWPTDPRVDDYPGVRDPGRLPGFRLVERQGGLALFALSSCSESSNLDSSALPPDGRRGTR
ncbi:hypothetical protein E1161_23960 [Saccharopolyspora aridisoli]|uniref:Uncharacterized protein n=1 Tax=Saccharopolyspora aridisoli TaxID=2530385 RepID=A0A4R4UAV7_9PSEU|nr:DUF6541 family protein [Saccharopolyspora aridisoli]TDC88300.1 hypothetical protein E1161_23960 [Saccharopolyspora aridisoli]